MRLLPHWQIKKALPDGKALCDSSFPVQEIKCASNKFHESKMYRKKGYLDALVIQTGRA